MNKKLLGLAILPLTILPIISFVSCANIIPKTPPITNHKNPDTNIPTPNTTTPIIVKPITNFVSNNLKITPKGQILGFYDKQKATKELVIKESYEGVDITSIGDKAFEDNQLTSLSIPNSVTSIGASSFSNANNYNSTITSITLGNSVKTIGNAAFFGNKLSSIIISNSVETIGFSSFSYNRITSLTIPNSVITIGDDAFSTNQLTSISKIIIPFQFNSQIERIRIGLPELL